jgi:hypothetical protein
MSTHATPDHYLEASTCSSNSDNARKIATVMADVCTFLIIECDRQCRDEDGRCIRLVCEETFGPKKRAANKKKKAHRIRKRQQDRKRLSAMPPTNAIKEAVRQAMTDLNHLAIHALGKDDLPPSLTTASTVMMVGIVFLNGFAGRSKEWEEMPRQAVADALAIGGDLVFVSTEETGHKTVGEYGDLGKYLAPGTIAAINDYFELPKKTELFFEPGPRSTKASVHTALRRFFEIYLPEHQALARASNIVGRLPSVAVAAGNLCDFVYQFWHSFVAHGGGGCGGPAGCVVVVLLMCKRSASMF